MKKVRVNATYRYVPCFMDRHEEHLLRSGIKTGDIVKVVNRYGCPPANTMGHCYVELNGLFIGMVANASLHNKKCGVQVDEQGKVQGENYCTCL